jgi:2-oxoglutarate ferredoxin oxidoreductase subunit alpha
MFELTVRAFNLAEKYRTPVILLADEAIAHLREQATVPRLEQIEIFDRKKPGPRDRAFFGSEEVAPMPSVGEGFNVAVTASTHDEYGVRFTQDPLVHRRMLSKLNAKINDHADDIVEVEDYNVDDCKVGIVSYGCTSRAVYEATERAEAEGMSTGYVRLKTIWPFPDKEVKRLAESAERIIVPEMNLGQISREVQRVACKAEIIPLNKIGGGELITPEELLTKILEGGKQSD